MKFELLAMAEGYKLLVDDVAVTGTLQDDDIERLIALLANREREWLDATEALDLAVQLNRPVLRDSLRRALNRGQIAGAQKVSISGRAKTEHGGQWRIPRAAFMAWLVGRRS